MNPQCAVCGVSSYWVGWVKELGEYRCLNHLPADDEKPNTGDKVLGYGYALDGPLRDTAVFGPPDHPSGPDDTDDKDARR